MHYKKPHQLQDCTAGLHARALLLAAHVSPLNDEQVTPVGDETWFFYLTNQLGFKPAFQGDLKIVTKAAAIAGTYLCVRNLPLM